LRSDRPYRAAWTEEKVLAHIINSSGTHFDPQVLNAFTRIFSEIQESPPQAKRHSPRPMDAAGEGLS